MANPMPLLLEALDRDQLRRPRSGRHLLGQWGHPGGPDRVDELVLGAHGPRFLAFRGSRQVQCFDPASGELEGLWLLSLAAEAVAMDASGAVLAVTVLRRGERHRALWRRDAPGELTLEGPGTAGHVTDREHLLVTPAGDRVVAARAAGHVLFDARTGAACGGASWRLPPPPPEFEREIRAVASSRDGGCLLVQFDQREIHDERNQTQESFLAVLDLATGALHDWRRCRVAGSLEALPEGWLADLGETGELLGIEVIAPEGLGGGRVLCSRYRVRVAEAEGLLVALLLPRDLVPDQRQGIGLLGARDGLPRGWAAAAPAWVRAPGPWGPRSVTFPNPGASPSRAPPPVRGILVSPDRERVVTHEALGDEERLVLRGPGLEVLLGASRELVVQGVALAPTPAPGEVRARWRALAPSPRDGRPGVARWSLATGEALPDLELAAGAADHLWPLAGGTRAVGMFGSHWRRRDGALRLLELDGGAVLREIPPGTTRHQIGLVRQLWTDPAARFVVYAAEQGPPAGAAEGLRVVDLEAGRAVAFVPSKHAAALVFARGEPLFAFVDGHRRVRLVALPAGESVEGPQVPEDSTVVALAFSPDDRFLLFSLGWVGERQAWDDAVLHVWDRREGREVLTHPHPLGPPSAMAFSDDGARLYTAGLGRVVFEWDAEALLDEATRR